MLLRLSGDPMALYELVTGHFQTHHHQGTKVILEAHFVQRSYPAASYPAQFSFTFGSHNTGHIFLIRTQINKIYIQNGGYFPKVKHHIYKYLAFCIFTLTKMQVS